MNITLLEGLRPFEFIVGEVLGGIGGILFRAGHASNTPNVQTRSENTVVAISSVAGATFGLVVPWDPASADVGTAKAVGIAGYAITGVYTGTSVPDSYLGQGPVRVRKDRMNYPGAGTAAGDAALVAALSPLGFNVYE